MSLSFEDSLKQAISKENSQKLRSVSVASLSLNNDDEDIIPMAVAYSTYSNNTDNWILMNDKYSYYEDYSDDSVSIIDVDKDFTLAIDYKFLSDTSANGVLAQCFQSNGSNGFKLWYNNGVKFTWGTSSTSPTYDNSREMVVIRHKKGENNLTIYNSNLNSNESNMIELERTKSTIADSTLVLGCMKADDGAYENFAIGDINWCKIWYTDLGDTACKKLVEWIHENITLEVCGFKRYYLSDNSTQRCSFSLLATHLLDHAFMFNGTNTNAGGWASSYLNKLLNTRLYNAMPVQIKALLKKVVVSSSIGQQSTEINSSDCYIYVPAAIELSNEDSINIEPYIYEGSTISYMVSADMRKRAYINGNYEYYWTRSPNISYSSNYVYTVNDSGKLYGFTMPNTEYGVLIELSF